MYGIVLMAALTTGGEVPTHGHYYHGCSSYGYGCYGCYGCSGCYGCGGCYGGYSSGCWGGCHGCRGGCYGCVGGCYGCGGCHGGWVNAGYYGCYGGYSCMGCYGGVTIVPSMPVVPGVGPVEKVPAPKPGDKVPEEAVRARLIVEVPADAVLYIDGVKMKTGSERRVFSTPALQPGQAYYYEVKAEIVRDGQTLSETSRVVILPGQEARASFATLTTQPATRTAGAGSE